MNFAKMKIAIFAGTPSSKRSKRNKAPIQQRAVDKNFQGNATTTSYFPQQSIEQSSFDSATKPLETSAQVFLVPRKPVPASTIQQTASLQVSSPIDEIEDLAQGIV